MCLWEQHFLYMWTKFPETVISCCLHMQTENAYKSRNKWNEILTNKGILNVFLELHMCSWV